MAQRHDENYNEQPMTRMGRIQQPSRRYRRLRHPSFTAAIWTANNPLLQRGEIGGEIDTHRIKMGDGVTYWNDLPYASDSIATWGDIQGNIFEQTDLQDALDAKANVADLATVATSGAFSDLTGKPTTLSGYGITDGANTSLSNLTSAGTNISKWSSNITNCITDVSQDINLTLSSGTLTLKAGSKCYLKTDTTTPSVNIISDLTTTQTTDGTYFAIYDGSALTTVLTTTYNYSTLPSTYSLPLAVVTVSSGAISSINQIFNGIGYIGSTAFALPGVKGLIPNGRNKDGTLKNSSFAINTIVTTTDGSGATGALEYYINGSGLFRANLGTNTYKEEQNIIINSSGVQQMVVALDTAAYRTGGQVTSLKPKTTFRAVDYNDSNYIANCAMPSEKYINLSSTTITDGLTLTAPADGYYSLYKVSTAAGQMIGFVNNNTGFATRVFSSNTNETLGVFIPVSKGQTIVVRNSAAGSTTYFRFIYANGAK